MTARETNSVEVAKTLALAIAYFKKELKEHDSALHKHFDLILQSKLAPLQEAIDTIPAPQQYVLPESVAHDSNLQALREAIDFTLEAKGKELIKAFADLEKKREQMAEDVSKEFVAAAEDNDKLKAYFTEELEKEANRLNESKEELLNSLGRVSAGLDGKINFVDAEFGKAHRSLTETVETNKKESEKALTAARETFTRAIKILDEMVGISEENAKKELKTLAEDVATQFKTITISVDGRFAEVIQQLESAISTVVADMEQRFKKHGDAVEGRLSAADKKRSIQDQAIAKRVEDFEKNVTRDIAKNKTEIADTNIRLGQTEERLATAIGEVDKKLPDKKDILLKKDLASLKKEIVKEIPVPKDGTDAHEWLFRPHPSKRGVMLYKREDWPKWKEVVLAVNPPQDNWMGGQGGGGVPTVNNYFSGTKVNYKAINQDTIVVGTDVDIDVWLVDATAGDVVLTLPAVGSRDGRIVYVKKTNSVGGNVYVLPLIGGDTVESDTQIILEGPLRPSITLLPAINNWIILSAYTSSFGSV